MHMHYSPGGCPGRAWAPLKKPQSRLRESERPEHGSRKALARPVPRRPRLSLIHISEPTRLALI
eukprot:8429347-Alexandrium_andersonii.AAC.1